MRVGSEVWGNGNTANSDWCKTSGSDRETSNINLKKIFNLFSFVIINILSFR